MKVQKKKFSLSVYLLISLMFFISCVSCTKQDAGEKIGVVLSGGGAKGAYEIGVWKAFDEYGITKNVSVISGTSVGALNAALFACTDSETQEEIWKNEVGYYSFMKPDKKTLLSAGKTLLQIAAESDGEDGIDLEEFGLNVLGKVSSGLLDYALNDNHSAGLFDREPLRKIMEKNISLEKISESGIDVYATALEKKSILLQYLNNDESCLYTFLLNEQTNDKNIHDILMASSALPGVYPSQSLDKTVVVAGKETGEKKEFVDGGFSDAGGENTPLAPLQNYPELKKIFVIYLRSDPSLRKFKDGESAAEIIHIVPSEDLGDMKEGTVNFSADKISALIELGYKDACEVLEANGYKKSINIK